MLGLAADLDALSLHAKARQALDEAIKLGATADQAWLLLAHWANERESGVRSSKVSSELQPHLLGVNQKLIEACLTLFEHMLGGYSVASWRLSRVERLKHAADRARHGRVTDRGGD